MFAALLSHRPLRTCRSSSVSVLLSRNAGSGGRDSNVCVMFDKILVANRGEIAARVMRTARRMGIRSVAVYSEADRNSMHVAMADEAHCIGPPPANESYLRQDKIMEVAKATGAQAIHPGYGFLSENKNFAELCQREGVEFIGPPSSAIEKMGIKRVSKKIMSESSVPIVPGYFGQDQSDERLKEEAVKLGFPVMLKADLGGGGKGMRTVSNAGEFQTLLEACRSESLKSFSDDKVMVEKFVVHPRHVEVQVFGDKRGNTVHLFERDCSVQRRHQKVIEEAPAPGLREEVKREMCLAAVRAAKAVGYVGAGTVEFIVDADQNFYFMEMNTRLQVEHPVTEMITGADLVEWQLRVAAGEEVPLGQEQLRHTGHAFEARIYAEDPDKNFIPSPGILKHLQAPRPQGVVRIDTGVRQGDEVTTFYDPLIAKLVVWGDNRSLALKRMKEALLQYQVAGVRTNIGFLERVCSNQSFQQGDVHTGFIPQHEKELFSSPAPLTEFQRKQAVLALLALENWTSTASTENDHYSPFSDCSGARLNLHHHRRVTFNAQGSSFDVDVSYDGQGGFELTCDGSEPEKEGAMMEPARGRLSQGEDGNLLLSGFIGDRTVSANLALLDQTLHIFTLDGGYEVELPKASFITAKEADVGDVARSPAYSTTVNKVLVRPGDKVSKGSVLITVEGMKMETNILATKDCVIKELLFREKDTVPANSTLVEFEE